MPSAEVIFFSVGLLGYILLEHSATVGRMFVRYPTQKQPSIIRKIGSCLTCIKAQRLIIICRVGSGNLSQEDLTFKKHDILRQELQATKKFETKMEQLETKIEQMNKTLLNIQELVTKGFMNHERLWSDTGKECSEDPFSTSIPELSPRMREMPPPPPMPSTPLMKPYPLKNKNTQTTKHGLSSLLEELSKKPPRLRHVELTPGGRPLRLRRVNNSNMLRTVLRKRFEAIHSSP